MKNPGRVLGLMCSAMLIVGVRASEAGPMSMSGEFAVNEVGAATYTVPVAVPPGMAGMEPKLMLSYNSMSGSGLLGMGWTLGGLTSITRCPRTLDQDGVRGGVNYDLKDKYCQDGQRLNLVSGTYGVAGSEYRTERESYSQIKAYGVAGNGPAYFIAKTKSGLTLEYGASEDARVEAQGKTSVRVWAVSKISDAKGNYLTVSYTENNAKGDYVPASIRYTGNGSQIPKALVEFVYEDKPELKGASDALFVAGSAINSLKRLSKITLSQDDAVVREYRMGYENNKAPNNVSRLVEIQQCAGSDAASLCMPKTAFTWQLSTAQDGKIYDAPGRWFITSDFELAGLKAAGDFNGDSLTDYVLFDGRCLTARASLTGTVNYSNGSGSSQKASVPWLEAGCDAEGVLHAPVALAGAGDVNGDGLADIVFTNGKVLISTGTGFQPSRLWFPVVAVTCPSLNSCSESRLAVGDFNGDGLADMVQYVWPGAEGGVSTLNGEVFYSNGVTGSHAQAIVICGDVGACGRVRATAGAGDVNGDGLDDVVFRSGGVMLSTGSGFKPVQGWFPDMLSFNRIFTAIGDYNGDGLAEGSMTAFPGETCSGWLTSGDDLYYSDGKSYSGSATMPWSSAMCLPTTALSAGDVNGDGIGDVVMRSGSVALGRVDTPNLMVGIRDGLGRNLKISYSSLSDAKVYTAETGSAYPLRDILQQNRMLVVSQTSVDNGTGGQRAINYQYGGARVHAKGQGFLGFRWTSQTDSGSGVSVRTEYRQDFPYTSLPQKVEKNLVGAGNNVILSRVTTDYQCLDPQTGAACVVAPGNRYFPHASQQVEAGWDISGVALPQVTTRSQYDRWGNATKITIETSDGYTKTTDNVYSNNASIWLLGRLMKSTVTSSTP